MKKILIIEDEREIALLQKDYLQAEGFRVPIETNGKRGLRRALTEAYDLYILDLILPGIDGFAILKRLRKEKNVPILMVSAKKDDIDKVKGFGLGADDYICKPFSPRELVARVKAHIDRFDALTMGRQMREAEIVAGEIRINRVQRRVWINDEEKNFTAREYDLLVFFAENPNQVFSKRELFSKIWEMEPAGDFATVTVHINKLREKIEPDSSNPRYIETVWGLGYRFNV